MGPGEFCQSFYCIMFRVMKYVPFVWCQIDSGAKLTLLHSWCQIGPVPNWLRCQIDSFHTLGAKLGPVPNWLFYTLGAKLTPQHSWCQIGSGAKLGPVPNCPPTYWVAPINCHFSGPAQQVHDGGWRRWMDVVENCWKYLRCCKSIYDVFIFRNGKEMVPAARIFSWKGKLSIFSPHLHCIFVSP